jgi:hypothetical protein
MIFSVEIFFSTRGAAFIVFCCTMVSAGCPDVRVPVLLCTCVPACLHAYASLFAVSAALCFARGAVCAVSLLIFPPFFFFAAAVPDSLLACVFLQPKQVTEIKDFLLIARRKDAQCKLWCTLLPCWVLVVFTVVKHLLGGYRRHRRLSGRVMMTTTN